MFVAVERDKDYTQLVVKKMRKITRRYGGFPTGKSPTKKWLDQRYPSAYLRDSLMDLGIMTDTLETAVNWENLMKLWRAVREYIKARSNTVCMAHLSHIYENGANLYFSFLSPMSKGNEIDDFINFQSGIIDTIHANGGSLSHHHGIGKLFGTRLKQEFGEACFGLLQAIKKYCDPEEIMNPGGTLGFK
jgi:alkyldihydroxyacetonephosphate synthase